MIDLLVTSREAELLDDIADIGFGEIYDVCLGERTPAAEEYELSERQANFLKLARRGMILSKIMIHDGEPSLAEYEGYSSSGYTCLFKVKF